MKTRYLFAIILLLITSIVRSESGSGSVTGNLLIDDNSIPMKYVYSKTQENPFDNTRKDLLVVFADRPVAESDLDRATLFTLSKAGKFQGFTISIDDKREAVSLTVFPVVQKSGNKVCELELKTFSVSQVAGRAYMKQKEESFGQKYQFDVTFDTPVKDVAVAPLDEKNADALPANGGDPGKAYLAYDKAVRAADLETMKKFVADTKQASRLDEPSAKEMIGLMQTLRAKDIKFQKGFVKGDRATLYLSGKSSEGNSSATIRMIKVAGQWKIEKESWK